MKLVSKSKYVVALGMLLGMVGCPDEPAPAEVGSQKAKAFVRQMEQKIPSTLPSEFDPIFRFVGLDRSKIPSYLRTYGRVYEQEADAMFANFATVCGDNEMKAINEGLDLLSDGLDLFADVSLDVWNALETSGLKHDATMALNQIVQYADDVGLTLEIQRAIKSMILEPKKASQAWFALNGMLADEDHVREIIGIMGNIDQNRVKSFQDSLMLIRDKFWGRFIKVNNAFLGRMNFAYTPKCQEAMSLNTMQLQTKIFEALSKE